MTVANTVIILLEKIGRQFSKDSNDTDVDSSYVGLFENELKSEIFKHVSGINTQQSNTL